MEIGQKHHVSDVTPVLRTTALQEARERTRASRPLRSLFCPRGVAVVGASERPDSVGRAPQDERQHPIRVGTLPLTSPRSRAHPQGCLVADGP